MTANKKTVRNLILYVLAFNIVGWLGYFIAVGGGTVDTMGLGNLVWLAAPLLLSLLFRLFSKDWKDIGLKPHFKGNGKWYLVSILIFPVIITIVLLMGRIFGAISFANFNIGLFLGTLAAMLIQYFIKNILEEFAWRGYLTPKVNAIVKKPILGHLLVGLIWGTWHIPYYLGLLDQASLAGYTSQSMGIFLPLVILGMTLAGILFGEIRLITGSTWPALLMHTFSNMLIMALLTEGFVEISPTAELLFTPSWEGLLTMILITAAGLWLYRQRAQKN